MTKGRAEAVARLLERAAPSRWLRLRVDKVPATVPRRPTPERASPSRCLLPDPPRSAVRCRTCRLKQTCRFAAAALHGAPELRLGQAFQPYPLRCSCSPRRRFRIRDCRGAVDRRGKFGLVGSLHRIDLCSQAGPARCRTSPRKTARRAPRTSCRTDTQVPRLTQGQVVVENNWGVDSTTSVRNITGHQLHPTRS